MGGLIVRQEAALSICDGRRAAAVAIIDAHTQVVTPKPWYEFWKR